MRPRPARQRGAFLVEFALVFVVLLTFLFGIIETARCMYLLNILPEVTRRAGAAAANIDPSDGAAISLARQHAILRTGPGALLFGAPVTDDHVRIDYLALVRDGAGGLAMAPIASGSLPSGSARNRVNCAVDPNAAACIRLVRVRICAPGDASTCAPVWYESVFSWLPATLRLPTSTTIVPAESLGYTAGAAPGP